MQHAYHEIINIMLEKADDSTGISEFGFQRRYWARSTDSCMRASNPPPHKGSAGPNGRKNKFSVLSPLHLAIARSHNQ